MTDVLAHRGGVPTVRERLNPEDLLDWDRMTTIIANAEPWFSPGTSCAYHAYTFGFIIGEVIRRVDGRAFGRFLHEEIAAPHGLDVYVGLPADHDDRVSPLHAAATASSPLPENMDDLALATLTNPAISVELRNTTAWWRAEVPSSNGQATARSLAQLCGLLADDDPQQAVLNAATVDRLVHGGGPCNDRVLGPFMSGATMDWTLGFMRNPVGVFGASPTAFGYTGMGGSVAYFDPGRQLGVAYLVNQMRPGLFDDPRRIAIAHAVDTATR